MKKSKIILFLLLVFSTTLSAGSITLDPTNVAVYMYSSEKAPVSVAYNYLNRDFKKITGKNFTLHSVNTYASIPTSQWSIVIVNNTDGFKDLPSSISTQVTGRESHRVYVDVTSKQIILQGFDMRGTIFAIYTFSEKVLGVPPLWFWSSWTPQLKSQITLDDNLNIFFDVPDVRYRSFFPNDMDLFNPFIKISDVNMNVWIETMMRLKLNTSEQCTVIDIPTKKLNTVGLTIQKHGMILTSHHETILNVEFISNFWDDYWKKVRGYAVSPELSLTKHQDIIDYWRYAVEAIHESGIENLWVIGFRGAADRAFWLTFKNSPSTNAGRAKVINDFFPEQLQIIKDVTGNQHPEVRTILYNELVDLYNSGLLIPPKTSDIILTFSATRQDPYPNVDLVNFNDAQINRIGYYMNLQYYTTGCHLSQGEGPWKMEDNYKYALNKPNTKLDYSVLNLGNVREFLLTADANAKMMWKPSVYNTNDFISTFCTTYFGSSYSSQVSTLYRDFFNAFWEQRKANFPGIERQFIFQDLRIQNALLLLSDRFPLPKLDTPLTGVISSMSYQIVPVDNNALFQIDALINGMTKSITRWESVVANADNLYSQLPSENKVFFNDNLRTQAHFMHQISIALLNVAIAYKNKTNNILAAESYDKAYNAMSSAKKYIYEAQHDIFNNWYDGDSNNGKFNIPAVEARMKYMRDSILPPPLVQDTIFPIEDAYTNCSSSSTTNFGSSLQLKVSKYDASPNIKYNTYIKFDFSSLNIDLKDISELEFGIYKQAGGLSTQRRVSVAVVSKNEWSESTISGFYRGQNSEFSSSTSLSYFTKNVDDPAKWYKITSSGGSNVGLYQSVVNQTGNLLTLRLYPDQSNPATDDADAINFNSRENTTNKPYLLVTYKKSTYSDITHTNNPELDFDVYSADGMTVINSKLENYHIKISDILGRVLIDKNNMSGKSYFSNLHKGYYVIALYYNNNKHAKKILINH